MTPDDPARDFVAEAIHWLESRADLDDLFPELDARCPVTDATPVYDALTAEVGL